MFRKERPSREVQEQVVLFIGGIMENENLRWLEAKDLEDRCESYLDRTVEGMETFQEDHGGDGEC